DKIIITVAVVAVIGGIFLISSSYLSEKKDKVYDNVAFEIYDAEVLNNLENITGEDVSSSPSDVDDDDDVVVDNGGTTNSQKSSYIGTLEIPKINLKKGFVDPSSKYNDIEYNVTILEGSEFPDVENGNFILAAHSGTGSKAYFKNLYKLSNGDQVKVSYKGETYTYKIVKIYTQKKQGYLTIYRNSKKTTLTLITCTKDNKQLQTVYVAEKV
ncbi:MAG: sortase, partial [Bacilli bacterium]